MQLTNHFFNRDASLVARELLGKVIRRNYAGHWLAALIIETEAYYLDDKASHASLGFTQKRKALFMPPGTIYMYYARGKDSLNISSKGDGNAVLIKSAHYFSDEMSHPDSLAIMQQLNPTTSGQARNINRLCSGQTLLCKSLNLKVTDWDQKTFSADEFFIDDTDYKPQSVIQTTRLGIPSGRDEDLMQRFIDKKYSRFCSKDPLTQRKVNLKTL